MIRSTRAMIGNCLNTFYEEKVKHNQHEFETLIQNIIEKLDCIFSFCEEKKIPIEEEDFFKQVAGSTIQSNDIEDVSYLFSRNGYVVNGPPQPCFHYFF